MMRSKRLSFAALMATLLLMAISAAGQNIRCSYEFRSKKEPGGKFSVISDMRLDRFGQKTAWYSERDLVRDSLSLIAFDETGSVSDAESYGELVRSRVSGVFSATVIDWQDRSFLQHYVSGSLKLNGSGELSLPEWVLSDEEKEIEGYLCRKATARYLGRDWTVWYTEEIPLQNGPWLLWGAPGLIVDARDAEDLFAFRFMGAEPLLEGTRFELLHTYYSAPRSQKKAKNYINDTFRNVELTYTKMRTDVDFFDQTHGIKSSRVISADGKEIDRTAFWRYIPLIPSEYWKNYKF